MVRRSIDARADRGRFTPVGRDPRISGLSSRTASARGLAVTGSQPSKPKETPMVRAHFLALASLAFLLACGASDSGMNGADAKSKSLGDQAKDAIDGAKKMLDPKSVGDSSFSLDKLKESMDSLSTENLK